MNSNNNDNEYTVLKEKYYKILKENEQLKNNIINLQDLFGREICEYFEKCNSLIETTKKFFFSNVLDCCEALLDYYGSPEPLEYAKDYKQCYKDIFGRDYEETEDEDEEDDDEEAEEEDEEENKR
jgi:hypothetical protein